MYTFSTKNFTVIFCRRHPYIVDEPLDLPEMDTFLMERAEKQDRVEAEKERVELDAARVWQERFFATLCLPVPPEAQARPLQMLECHTDPVLYHGDYGITMRIRHAQQGRAFIVYESTYHTVRRVYGISRKCSSHEVVPWLLRLFVDFDPEIVWRAFQGSVRRDVDRDNVDAICRTYNLPLSGATFALATEQNEPNVARMHVDGAIVYLYPDHFAVVARPEKLTPWSKMVLARPDARAILSEIARAVEH